MVRFDFICKNVKTGSAAESAYINSSRGRYNSTRVDEGRDCSSLLAIKMKARTVLGRGEGGGGPPRYVTLGLSCY